MTTTKYGQNWVKVPCVYCGSLVWTTGSMETPLDRAVTRAGVLCYDCRETEQWRKQRKAKTVQA